MAAARLRMRARVLLEEADTLVDVLRVLVDGRHRDAGEVVREEAAGSVVVAVGGAVAAALPVRGAAGEEAQVPRAPRGDAAEDFDDERHHVVVLVVDGVIVVALVEATWPLPVLWSKGGSAGRSRSRQPRMSRCSRSSVFPKAKRWPTFCTLPARALGE